MLFGINHVKSRIFMCKRENLFVSYAKYVCMYEDLLSSYFFFTFLVLITTIFFY